MHSHLISIWHGHECFAPASRGDYNRVHVHVMFVYLNAVESHNERATLHLKQIYFESDSPMSTHGSLSERKTAAHSSGASACRRCASRHSLLPLRLNAASHLWFCFLEHTCSVLSRSCGTHFLDFLLRTRRALRWDCRANELREPQRATSSRGKAHPTHSGISLMCVFFETRWTSFKSKNGKQLVAIRMFQFNTWPFCDDFLLHSEGFYELIVSYSIDKYFIFIKTAPLKPCDSTAVQSTFVQNIEPKLYFMYHFLSWEKRC